MFFGTVTPTAMLSLPPLLLVLMRSLISTVLKVRRLYWIRLPLVRSLHNLTNRDSLYTSKEITLSSSIFCSKTPY
ncbi:MAG: hypothetical protein V7L21_26195 [Nostoc sp.]|uniref:hypothetical protein n=1 Tax=Nostoc sp. NMS9 TaxID=2815393 RepID=UPI0026010707|nr:hypothetical protein [Nostoc sp. NMS9]MBN3942975.1 hypothetical protein [Nostoc sp. NMS9]